MTGTDAQTPGDPADGPLSLELLADLHAGVLDEQVAAQLRRRIATDPQAGAVLAALDATVADLVAFPQQRAVRMPDEVALRLDAALTAEAARAPAVGCAARRRHRMGWAAAGLLAAASVGALALSGVQWEIAGTPKAADALGTATGVHPAPPLALNRADLGSALDEAQRSRDFGALSPPARLSQCLAANGAGEGSAPIGAREVTLDGRPGILLVLTTGQLGEFRLLVVGPDCGPGNPAQLANSVVSGR
ncbi:MAG: hypothetical protein ABR608_03110 [Pseudonocardiaceae bacterium]